MVCCCTPPTPPVHQQRFKRVLWLVLSLNLLMFVLEIFGGLHSHSSALWADAVDFFADSANYLISLVVLRLSVYWRATAALAKGLTMLVLAGLVLGKTLWSYLTGIIPEPISMGAIALLALGVNLICALLLYRFRDGEANMQSVWLCSRNDALANIAVVLAAIGVFGSGSLWPDLMVAMLMAALAIGAGIKIIRLARQERSAARHNPELDNNQHCS